MTGAARTFVLVQGAWAGAWYWREVADILRSAGHRVFAPSLTGLGDRQHLLSPDIDLSIHIADIVGLIESEQLSDIVLVGHSYGGLVITGVADRLPDGTIFSIVFLDAFLPDAGQSLADIIGPEAVALFYGDADPIPPPPLLAQGDPGMAKVFPRCSPQPRKSKFEPVKSVEGRERIPRKTFIQATGAPGGMHDATVARLVDDPTWRVEKISCGHCTMIDRPGETAELLLQAAT